MDTIFAEKYDLFKCFQCGKCSAGCPVLLKSPLNIRRIMREALLRDSVDSICQRSEIWDCTTCQTCTIRCPRGLRPHELLMALRSSLVEEGNIPETVSEALENVFKQGNPWGRPRSPFSGPFHCLLRHCTGRNWRDCTWSEHVGERNSRNPSGRMWPRAWRPLRKC